MKASPSQSAAALIVAALALVALASGRLPPRATPMLRAPARASQSALHALREGELLDLNRAQAADLLLLPGVGPKLAQRIVDERSRRGRYHGLEELLEVKGIGRTTLQRLRRFVRIEPESPMQPAIDRATAKRLN